MSKFSVIKDEYITISIYIVTVIAILCCHRCIYQKDSIILEEGIHEQDNITIEEGTYEQNNTTLEEKSERDILFAIAVLICFITSIFFSILFYLVFIDNCFHRFNIRPEIDTEDTNGK